MAVVELPFQSTSSIAVVTRYKATHTAMPKGGTGHTDCVLPNGAPVGFFSTGLPISRGVVYGYALYASTRPHYIYAADARTASCISTILILSVGKKRCEKFLKAWLSMRAKTTSYSLFSDNCASHASTALHAAGVLRRSEIPGLDTPGKLHDTIIKDGLVPWISQSGYLEFQPVQCGVDEMLLNFRVTLEPVTTPTKGGPVWV